MKDFEIVIDLGDERLNKQMELHDELTKISHYTSTESLKKILKTKTLLLNRIDRVNDSQEAEILKKDEMIKCVFLSCFTFLDDESAYHWCEYGDCGKGICINLYKNEKDTILKDLLDASRAITEYSNNNSKNYLWQGLKIAPTKDRDQWSGWIVRLSAFNTLYEKEVSSEPILIEAEDGKSLLLMDLKKVGLFKDAENWGSEKETRILGIVDSTNKKCRFHDIEGLLLPIEFERLPKVEIIFGPQACDSEKEEIKELCKEYDNFSFRDSSLSIDDIKKECNNK